MTPNQLSADKIIEKYAPGDCFPDSWCEYGSSAANCIRELRKSHDNLAAQLAEREREIARLRGWENAFRAIYDGSNAQKLDLIENFCETHRPFASPKSEVITRRILWAIRGSNDNPPHPERSHEPD